MRRRFFIYLMIVGFALFFSVQAAHFIVKSLTRIPTIDVVQTTSNDVTRDKLVRWAYSHSTLISRSQCIEIVHEVMKTKHPVLMIAIIELESKKFTPGALSRDKAGKPLAMGWCQINYRVHGPELIKAGIIKEERDLWDTGPNIKAGAMVLEESMVKHKGNVPAALEGYLGGKDGAYVNRIHATFVDISIYIEGK